MCLASVPCPGQCWGPGGHVWRSLQGVRAVVACKEKGDDSRRRWRGVLRPAGSRASPLPARPRRVPQAHRGSAGRECRVRCWPIRSLQRPLLLARRRPPSRGVPSWPFLLRAQVWGDTRVGDAPLPLLRSPMLSAPGPTLVTSSSDLRHALRRPVSRCSHTGSGLRHVVLGVAWGARACSPQQLRSGFRV